MSDKENLKTKRAGLMSQLQAKAQAVKQAEAEFNQVRGAILALESLIAEMPEHHGGGAVLVGIDTVDVQLVIKLRRVDDGDDGPEAFHPGIGQRLPQHDAMKPAAFDLYQQFINIGKVLLDEPAIRQAQSPAHRVDHAIQPP